jgi:hypothetical protein
VERQQPVAGRQLQASQPTVTIQLGQADPPQAAIGIDDRPAPATPATTFGDGPADRGAIERATATGTP